jgi:hypothetical protein
MSTRVRPVLTTALLLLIGSRAAAAQTITTAGSLGTITIVTAVAGSDPTSVAGPATTYTLTTKKNKGITRVTANLDVPLPAGVTLTVSLPSPGGGIISSGPVALSTAPQNVLTNLPDANTGFPATTISYTLSATATAGVVPLSAYKITFALQ